MAPAGGQPTVNQTGKKDVFTVTMRPQAKLAQGLKGISVAAPSTFQQQLAVLQSAGKVPECTGTGWMIDGGAYLDGLAHNKVEHTGEELERGLYSPEVSRT